MGFLSKIFGGDDKGAKESAGMSKAMQQKWAKMYVPTAEDLKLELPAFDYQASGITPAQIQTYLQAQSDLAGYEADPLLRGTQLDVLQQQMDIANDPTLSDMDKAALYEIVRTQGRTARGARDALMQNAAQRGVSGSGLDLVQQMIANQGAADTAAAGGYELAGQADARRRAALQAAGQMAGDVRGQDMSEAEKIAAAKDMINKFNTQQRTAAAQFNEENRVKQQQAEQMRKDVAQQANYDAALEMARNAAAIPERQFEMEKSKLAGESNQLAGAQSALQAQDAASNQRSSNIISTAGTVAGIAAMFSDQRMKENVEPISDEEAQEMLGNLTGYKYNYRPEAQERLGLPGGEQMGVMAQDLEKSSYGDGMVADTSEGKVVNFDPNTITALLANINDRLEKMENK